MKNRTWGNFINWFGMTLLMVMWHHAAFAISHSESSDVSPQTIVLGVGQTHPFSPGLKSPIRVGSAKIITVKEMGNRLLLIGKSKGTTQLYAGHSAWNVVVTTPDTVTTHSRLSRWNQSRMGLNLSVREDRVVIGGELLRLADWLALGEEMQDLPGRAQFAAKMRPELEQEAIRHFEALLAQSHLPATALLLKPQASILLSPVEKEQAHAFEQVLGKFGFSIHLSSKAISIEPQVEIQVQVAEIKKTFLRKYGVAWPSSYEAQILPRGGDSPLQVSLQALEQQGNGKILASPTLLCRSGKEAQFLAGGEIPIKIMNFKVNDVVWKRYGVMLKFRPAADFSGRMSIEIDTEVSSIDKASAVEGLPGFLTHRVQSHFDLDQSRTVALSGLIKQDRAESHEGLPLLSRLPVLGPLFSSRDFAENRSELVIFVTPRIIKGHEISASQSAWSERLHDLE